MKKTLSKIALILFCVLLSSAHADDQEKIAFIQNHFDLQSRHNLIWQNGWLTVVGLNTAINASAYHNAKNDSERVDTATALAVSALGLSSSVQRPMQTHLYADKLAAIPSETNAEQNEKRQQAEKWLMQAANRESYEQSTKNRLISGAVHGIAGLIIATEGSGEKEALMSFASGMLFSELKIRTAPKQSIKALADYKLGLIDAKQSELKDPTWQFSFDGRKLAAEYLLY